MPWWDRKPKQPQALTEQEMVERVRKWHSYGDDVMAMAFVHAILDRWTAYLRKLPITWEDMETILFDLCINGDAKEQSGLYLIDFFNDRVKGFCKEHGIELTPHQTEKLIEEMNLTKEMGYRSFLANWGSGVENLGGSLAQRAINKKRKEQRIAETGS